MPFSGFGLLFVLTPLIKISKKIKKKKETSLHNCLVPIKAFAPFVLILKESDYFFFFLFHLLNIRFKCFPQTGLFEFVSR